MNLLGRSLLRLGVACALVLLLVPAVAQAQAVLATIQGYISDDSGASLPGATVVVRNQGTGTSRTLVTDEAGRYRAAGLEPGVYTVTASLDGFQTVQRENVELLVGQIVDVNLRLAVADVSEVITVTSDAPLVEVSRSSAAAYVSEREIESLPILGRDFKQFAYLTPTVQADTVRGFVTMSGQRGMYSGMNIDGTSAKSAFFGYARGGEATENDGIVVAQDSVKEFQIITSAFAPEVAESGGAYINVVTQAGTNDLRGSGFFYTRDESLHDDFERSPLDVSRGNSNPFEPAEFSVDNYGISVGGPIVRDRTHFFLSLDQTDRSDPTFNNLSPGAYDVVAARAAVDPRFAPLLDGYVRNPDGSADGQFLREIDNLVVFGKINQQFTDAHNGNFRINYTDYERISSFRDEESEKLNDSLSLVASLVSVIGSAGLNEFRLQHATENLDRLSLRVGEPIEAQIRLRFPEAGFESFGKFDFLPIYVEEKKLQLQETFSYLFGEHDLKFGVDYQQDDLSQLFAGSKDGRYDFSSLEGWEANEATNVRIYFGNVQNPNYDETQALIGAYAQDTYKPSADLTLNFGFRYGKTDNPDGLEHLFPEGRNIPDDDHIAPRFGFAYSLDEDAVIRGGIGYFYGRTPSLIFASQVQQNGLYPNFGRLNVGPDDIGYVPLGTPIDNENPPLDAPNSPSYVDPDFKDAEFLRLNLGYERQLGGAWSTNLDYVYSEGSKLQSNVELNRTFTYDEFGRPVYSSTRPDPNFNEIFVRRSLGESEYHALTLGFKRRFSGRYMFQGHYTWSEDKDNDSNERSATGVTLSDPTNPNYDWGLSDRDVTNRVVLSGLVVLPWDFKLSGIFEYRDGRPWTAQDLGADFAYCGFGRLGFNCNVPYAIENGAIGPRNGERNESITKVDMRLGKAFSFGDWDLDLFLEVFNLLDDQAFAVATGFGGQSDPNRDEFGLADIRVTDPRQWQIGIRVSFK